MRAAALLAASALLLAAAHAQQESARRETVVRDGVVPGGAAAPPAAAGGLEELAALLGPHPGDDAASDVSAAPPRERQLQASSTPTPSGSLSPTPTATASGTLSRSATSTASSTGTAPPTRSSSAAATPSRPPSSSGTPSSTPSCTLPRTPTATPSQTPSQSATTRPRETCALGALSMTSLPSGLNGFGAQSVLSSTTSWGHRTNVTCPHYARGAELVTVTTGVHKLVLMQIDAGIDVLPGYTLSLDTCQSRPTRTPLFLFMGFGCPSAGWPTFRCEVASFEGCPGITNWTFTRATPARILYVYVAMPAGLTLDPERGERVRIDYALRPPAYSPTPTPSWSPSPTAVGDALSGPRGLGWSASLSGLSGTWTRALNASSSHPFAPPTGGCANPPLYPYKPWLAQPADLRFLVLIDLGEDMARNGGSVVLDTCGSTLDTVVFVSEAYPSAESWNCDAYNDDADGNYCSASGPSRSQQSMVRYDSDNAPRYLYALVSGGAGPGGAVTLNWRYVLPTPSAPVTPAGTPSRTVSTTLSATASLSQGASPSHTPTSSLSAAPTLTPSGTPSTSGSASKSGSNDATPSVSPTRSPTATGTPFCPVARLAGGGYSQSVIAAPGVGAGVITGSLTDGRLFAYSAQFSGAPTTCRDQLSLSLARGAARNVTLPDGGKHLILLDLGTGFRPGGNLTIDTCMSPYMDTVVAVGAGCPDTPARFQCESASDNWPCTDGEENPRQSTVTVFNARARVWSVLVGGAGGATAPYTLSWRYTTPPSSSPTPQVDASPFPTQSTTIGVTRSQSPTLSGSPSVPGTPPWTATPSATVGTPTPSLSATGSVGVCGLPESGVRLDSRLVGLAGSLDFYVVGLVGQVPFGSCAEQNHNGVVSPPGNEMFIAPGPQGLFQLDLGFTPGAAAGTLEVSANSTSGDVDTQLFLGTSCPTGASLQAMSCVAANEDFPSLSTDPASRPNRVSRVRIEVVPGVRVYYVLVPAWAPRTPQGVTGAFRLTWAYIQHPRPSESSLTPTASLARGASPSVTPLATRTASSTASITVTPNTASSTVTPNTASSTVTPSPVPLPNQFQASDSLLVLRLGGGESYVGIAAGVSMPLFVDEYGSSGAQTGVLFQSIPAPSAPAASYTDPGPCSLASGQTSAWLYDEEGLPATSRDGKSVVFACYSTHPGRLLSPFDPKTIASLRVDGSWDLSTKLRNAFAAVPNASFPQAVRSVATVDGSRYWVAGVGGGPRSGGVWTVQAGQGLGEQVSGSVVGDVGFTDVRCLSTEYGSRLWASTTAADSDGIFAAWTGLPELPTAGSTTPPGFASDSAALTFKPFQFVFENASSLWVAGDHERASANIYHFVAANLAAPWRRVAADSISVDRDAPVMSLVGRSESGATGRVYTLYASTQTRVYRVDAYTGTSVAIIRAAAGAQLRGVALPPQSSALVAATPPGTPSRSPAATFFPSPSMPPTRSVTATLTINTSGSNTPTLSGTRTRSGTPVPSRSAVPTPMVVVYGYQNILVLRSGSREGELGGVAGAGVDGAGDFGSPGLSFQGLYLDEFHSYRLEQGDPVSTAPLPGTLDFAYSIGFGAVWPPRSNGTNSSAGGVSGTPSPAPSHAVTAAAASAFIRAAGYGHCTLGGSSVSAGGDNATSSGGEPDARLLEGWPSTTLDGRFVVVPCYDAPEHAPYTPTANKTIVLVRSDGTLDASSRFADAYVTGGSATVSGRSRPAFVSAVSTNGSYFYLSGVGEDRGFDTGIRGVARGGRFSTLVLSTVGLNDPRGLFLLQAGPAAARMYAAMGPAETRTGSAVVAVPLHNATLPGWEPFGVFPPSVGIRAFAIHAGTVYASDDRPPSLGQLWRWSRASGVWVDTSVMLDPTRPENVYAVAGRVEATFSCFVVYATTRSRVYRYITESGVVSVIAVASPRTTFRGVVFAPNDPQLEPRSPTPSGTRTPSKPPSASASPPSTVTASPTITVTGSNSATTTASPTESVTATSTPSHTRTASPTQSSTRTSTSSSSVTPSNSPTSSVSATATRSSTPTRSSTGTRSSAASTSETRTPSITPSGSGTPAPTPSSTVTASPTVTSTRTVSATPTTSPTPSITASDTLTQTRTSTPTPSVSGSITGSQTHTASVTAAVTPSRSISSTASISRSAVRTPTSTPTDSATRTSTVSRGSSASASPSFVPVPPMVVSMVLSVSAISASTLFDAAAYFNPNVTAAEQAQLLSVSKALRTDGGCFAGVVASGVKVTKIYDVALGRGDIWFYAGDPINAPLGTPAACPSVGPAAYSADDAPDLTASEPSPSPVEARRLAHRVSTASTTRRQPRGGQRARLLAAASNRTGADVYIEFSLPPPAFNPNLAGGSRELYAEFTRQVGLQKAASERLEAFINELVDRADEAGNPALYAFFGSFLSECAARLNVSFSDVSFAITEPAVVGPAAVREGPEPDEPQAGPAAQGRASAAELARNSSIGSALGGLCLFFMLLLLLFIYRRRRRQRAESDKAVVVIGCADNPMRKKEPDIVEETHDDDDDDDDDLEAAAPAPVVVAAPAPVVVAAPAPVVVAAPIVEEVQAKPEKLQGKGPDVVIGYGLGGGRAPRRNANPTVVNPMAVGSKRAPKAAHTSSRARDQQQRDDEEAWANERRKHSERKHASQQRSYHHSSRHNSRGAAPAADTAFAAQLARYYYADNNNTVGVSSSARAAGSERRQPLQSSLPPVRAVASKAASKPQQQPGDDDGSSGDDSVRRMSVSTFDEDGQAAAAAAAAAVAAVAAAEAEAEAMAAGPPADAAARSRARSSASSTGV